MTVDRVLVTGCAGFIGSTLVDELLAQGREVIGVDAFEPFYDRADKDRNVRSAMGSPAFRFHEVDTRDRDAFERVVLDVRPGVIVDFAARAGVRDSLTDPWRYIDINVSGVQNQIAAAAKAGAAYVFASSSSVYGTGSEPPFRESTSILRPTSPYGATKVAGEALLAAHHNATGLRIGIARLFTVYGPRQRPDLAVRKFADALTSGRTIPLYDGGEGIRDYTFVGDIVAGFVALIDTAEPALTVNFGAGQPHTTAQMLTTLERLLGVRGTVEHLPPQPGDMARTQADVSVARAKLGWAPATTLESGLRAFADWYASRSREGQDATSA